VPRSSGFEVAALTRENHKKSQSYTYHAKGQCLCVLPLAFVHDLTD
jgi:hypothetical protein